MQDFISTTLRKSTPGRAVPDRGPSLPASAVPARGSGRPVAGGFRPVLQCCDAERACNEQGKYKRATAGSKHRRPIKALEWDRNQENGVGCGAVCAANNNRIKRGYRLQGGNGPPGRLARHCFCLQTVADSAVGGAQRADVASRGILWPSKSVRI